MHRLLTNKEREDIAAVLESLSILFQADIDKPNITPSRIESALDCKKKIDKSITMLSTIQESTD